MMGKKKLATIREELRQAFAGGGSNPITALDRKLRKLRKLTKQGITGGTETRSLQLLRDALAQVVGPRAEDTRSVPPQKRPKQAM